MLQRLRHLRRDERGISLLFVGAGMISFMIATTLAIDVGMMMTARSQAQNAADGGALAGADALAFNNFNDRSATGPAVKGAISTATSNQVMSAAPSVLPADVTFPNDPAGNPTRVKVDVFRTTARGNAVPTLIANLMGITTVDIVATATAEAAPANAETCVMPFTIPDKWQENSNDKGQADGPWTPTSTFDVYDNKGKPLANPDVYIQGVTSYNATTDKGLEIVLKQNNTGKVAPSMYNPWDLPGSVGGSDYRNNIETCNTALYDIGKFMPPENGNMVGPTQQGVTALIAEDPNAYWDTTCNCVLGSAFGVSPRVAKIPLYDPLVYANGAQSGKNAQLQVANYLGFFIESITGAGDVMGRITPISGLQDGGGGPVPTGIFPKVIRLVQ